MDNKDIDVIDYCCLDCFVDSIMDDVMYSDRFVTADIIANREMAQEIIRLLINYEDDDGNQFDIRSIDLSDEDYDDEYIISIDSEMNLYCTKMYQDNEYYTGYIFVEGDYAYIHSDCGFKLMNNVDSDCITVFGFQGIDD